MRDAFGGVFTMNLLLVFIFIYVAFTAVSLNYARAFRVKNKVIDFIEQKEITNIGNMDENDLDELASILNDASYVKNCEGGNGLIQTEEGNTIGRCHDGIVILEDRRENSTVYYKVTTYADWNLGALNKILALAGRDENSESYVNGSWAINGEARVVVKG